MGMANLHVSSAYRRLTYHQLTAVVSRNTAPVSTNHSGTPYASATGPETSRPTGMANDITLPISENVRPCSSGGMVSCK